VAKKSRRVIAIVGTAPSTRKLVNDEPDSVERWGLGGAWETTNKMDRFFEVHDRAWLMHRGTKRGAYHRYLDFLQHFEGPVYVLGDMGKTLQQAIEYPIDEMVEEFGRYLTSTVSYMLALAITEKPDEIKFYGVDFMTDMEVYTHQRAALEYLIGHAKGQGIKIWIPDASPLLKAPLYGRAEAHVMNYDALLERKATLERDEKLVVERLVSLRGSLAEVNHWIGQAKGLDMTRGIPDGAPMIVGGGRVEPPQPGEYTLNENNQLVHPDEGKELPSENGLVLTDVRRQPI
jgi:hypothetical protein